MRKYHPQASSAVRFQYGVELHAGLTQFPETAEAAGDMLDINDALHAQSQKRIALLVPMVKARAALRFAEYHVDSVIRSAYRAAQIEDGGRAGRWTQALFPNGVREVTRPEGRAQVKPTKELAERLLHHQLAGVETYRATWLPKILDALSQLETTISTYEAAKEAHHDAFAAERALRDAHHERVDRVMGLVRAAFPRDRDTQDVIFPPVTESRGGDDDPTPTPRSPLPV